MDADVAEVSASEQAESWEELAFAESSDRQTRSEALVNLTTVDASRGEYVLGAMLAADNADDRLEAVSVLNAWRNRTGDPDGRITGLLRQAASDPDEGIAYQARAALNQAESFEQGDLAAYAGDYPYDDQATSTE